ncbi:hypothetical protein [Bacillus sp. FJAT-28004]|nr:hypothetical protein [Bacillus sp. FJAT-28004]
MINVLSSLILEQPSCTRLSHLGCSPLNLVMVTVEEIEDLSLKEWE